jgi:hypothetical protein
MAEIFITNRSLIKIEQAIANGCLIYIEKIVLEKMQLMEK